MTRAESARQLASGPVKVLAAFQKFAPAPEEMQPSLRNASLQTDPESRAVSPSPRPLLKVKSRVELVDHAGCALVFTTHDEHALQNSIQHQLAKVTLPPRSRPGITPDSDKVKA